MADATDDLPPIPRKPGKVVHEWSRAKHEKVNQDTLYVLQSGPRAGIALGSNSVNYEAVGGTKQAYIASEAPYHVDDYFRMVANTGARTLVSLTTDHDVYSKRKRHPVDVHHLREGQSVTFDGKGLFNPKGGTTVTYVGESNFQSPYPNTSPILIKRYSVQKKSGKPYEVHHIVFKHWPDHGAPVNKYDALALVAAIDESQKQLAPGTEAAHPVVVNCGYGQGRTNALILMHQMAQVMNRQMGKVIAEDTEPPMRIAMMMVLKERLNQKPYQINVYDFIDASAKHVMPFGRGSIKPQLLMEFPAVFMDGEIKRIAAAAGLNPDNPTLPASPPKERPHSHVAAIKTMSPDGSKLR